MIERVRQFVGRATTDSFCECRLCGTTVDCTTSACPVCDSLEIARYDLP
jgi:rubrerythrin